MYKNFNEFRSHVANSVIEAVSKGGDTNVYICEDLGICVNNCSKAQLEFAGVNVIFTIECASYGDLGYESEEDFIIPDAESHYIDSVEEELEKLFLYYTTNPLYDMLTLQEAGLIWDKDDSTLRRVIQGPQFVEGVDYRKTGKVTLVTKEAMERVYGKREV